MAVADKGEEVATPRQQLPCERQPLSTIPGGVAADCFQSDHPKQLITAHSTLPRVDDAAHRPGSSEGSFLVREGGKTDRALGVATSQRRRQLQKSRNGRAIVVGAG